MLYSFIEIFSAVNIIYFFVIYLVYALLILLAFPEIIRRYNELNLEDFEHLLGSFSLPPISVIAPVYNEEERIIESIHSFIRLRYPKKEVIIVNDGSTDRTLEVLIREFQLQRVPAVYPQPLPTKPLRAVYRSHQVPDLVVIDKENGLKCDAMNAGLNISTCPVFLQIDSDTLVESDALLRMIRPMLNREGVYAEGATLRLLNGCQYSQGKVTKVKLPKNYWEVIQVGEYLRAFLYGRLGWNTLGGTLSISGAFGLFTKDHVIKVGGYDPNAIGEDLELTLAMIKEQKKHFKTAATVFVPDPVAWTEGPSSAQSLGRQRSRWHQGLIECLIKHRNMFMNPKYGWSGILGFPNLVFAEALQPLMEFFSYLIIVIGMFLGVVDWYYVGLFVLVCWGLNSILTMIAIMMELTTFQRYRGVKEITKLLIYAILENVGYRQLYFIWKIQGMIKYFRKEKTWVTMK